VKGSRGSSLGGKHGAKARVVDRVQAGLRTRQVNYHKEQATRKQLSFTCMPMASQALLKPSGFLLHCIMWSAKSYAKKKLLHQCSASMADSAQLAQAHPSIFFRGQIQENLHFLFVRTYVRSKPRKRTAPCSTSFFMIISLFSVKYLTAVHIVKKDVCLLETLVQGFVQLTTLGIILWCSSDVQRRVGNALSLQHIKFPTGQSSRPSV
jgi:hypothetical protein